MAWADSGPCESLRRDGLAFIGLLYMLGPWGHDLDSDEFFHDLFQFLTYAAIETDRKRLWP